MSNYAERDSWVRQNVESAYHPAGSCKMGKEDDPLAVVDKNCKVYGIGNLRVVDASVFPTLPNGNINAPVIMVAEKIADVVLGKNPLPSADLSIVVPLGWQNSQRNGKPTRTINLN